MTDQEIKEATGKHVRLELTPQAIGGPTRMGRIVGTLDAADGMVVTFAPDEAPGSQVTYHAHYIRAIHPA
ncbi:MAG TPA: hypothetical protein VEH53_02610 [archaeon]|nr:hypothetical protein [archaeon]